VKQRAGTTDRHRHDRGQLDVVSWSRGAECRPDPAGDADRVALEAHQEAEIAHVEDGS